MQLRYRELIVSDGPGIFVRRARSAFPSTNSLMRFDGILRHILREIQTKEVKAREQQY